MGCTQRQLGSQQLLRSARKARSHCRDDWPLKQMGRIPTVPLMCTMFVFDNLNYKSTVRPKIVQFVLMRALTAREMTDPLSVRLGSSIIHKFDTRICSPGDALQ
jgi:hypothetical protein